MNNLSLYKAILGNLKTSILLLKPDLSIIFVNASAETLLDTSESRVLNTSVQQLLREENKPPLLDKHNISAFTKREMRLSLPRKRFVTVDCIVTPVKDHITEETRYIIIELQPLDRLLKISREEGLFRAQQKSQAMVRGLAHEIKNPLGGLRGAAQLLSKEIPSDLQDYTEVIIAETDRLTSLVDNMLGANTLPNFEPVNIHEITERVYQLLLAEVGSIIKIVRDYDPSMPDLTADKNQLIQAVLNIMRNAANALQNTEQPRIVISTRILRQFTIGINRFRYVCHLKISDNGPGIPEDLRDTLFLPMVSSRANGNGLGLSISQSIINHHQGLIEFESEPGNTQFSLYIPFTDSIHN